MATNKISKVEPAPEAAPGNVKLHCAKLGKTIDVTPQHAKALLDLQADRRLTDWALAPDETPAPTPE